MTKLTKLKPVLNSPTLKLSFTYWLLIMVLSISFSIVFYHTSYRQLGRQAPPNEFFNNTTFNNPNQLGQNNAARARNFATEVDLVPRPGLSFFVKHP